MAGAKPGHTAQRSEPPLRPVRNARAHTTRFPFPADESYIGGVIDGSGREHSFDCDLRTHGERQIELKTWYPIIRSRRSRFDLDLYLFFPHQLGIDGSRYGPGDFLRDAKTYTRLSTPPLSLDAATDPGRDESPFARIRERLGVPGSESEIIYEFRVLASVFRRESRERRHDMRDSEEVSIDRFFAHIDLLRRFVDSTRALCDEVRESGYGEALATAADWEDESISIKADIEFAKLYRLAEGRKPLRPALETLVQAMREETRHRRSNGYPSVVDPEDPVANERVLYREGILKKWSQSALYLDTERRSGPSRFGHIAAALAAGAAMSFAVVATLLANRLFASYSVPWALLAVVAYVFKDRIKELTKSFLAALFPRHAADQSGRIADPATERRVGLWKSLIRMTSPGSVPEEVRERRNGRRSPFRDILPEDNILHFHKRTRLNGRRLASVHRRNDSITEILRVTVDGWLESMDDPTNELTYPEGPTPRRITANRVYHIHLFIRLVQRSGRRGSAPRLVHYRVVATRNGIVRIEQLNFSRQEQDHA